jgi:E3 ubiquitin-protein ligase DOA10
VVYVPPNFSTRITILFAWMWFFSVMLGLSMTLVPCNPPRFSPVGVESDC